MRDVDLDALFAYIEKINEVTQTTRRASEDFLDCPALPVVRRGETEARNLITTVYADLTVREVVWAVQHDLLHHQYWQLVVRGKPTSIAFGASDFSSLTDYFRVDQNRTHGAIVDRVRETYDAQSVPTLMLDAILAYAETLRLPTPLAARIATTHLAHTLPALAARARRQRAEHGLSATAAGTDALSVFTNEFVPRHIGRHLHLAGNVHALTALVGKPTFYNAPHVEGEPDTLTLSIDDAKGLMQVYPLQKMCYSPVELEMGDALGRAKAVQSALVLFHLHLLQHTVEYLHSHSNLAQVRRALLPMTEIFVLSDDENDLVRTISPNPKLLQVISNNVLPAIGSVLMSQGRQVAELQPEDITAGVAKAARNRVFHLQIGQFHSFDPVAQTVELESMFQRTCPAMPMLTASLSTWLPGIYGQVVNLS